MKMSLTLAACRRRRRLGAHTLQRLGESAKMHDTKNSVWSEIIQINYH